MEDLAKRAITAVKLAVLINVGLVWLFLELDIPASTEYFEYGGVVFLTTLGVIAAIAVYYLLSRWSASTN